MAVDMNETEAKYEAPASLALPDLDDLPQVAGTSGPDEEQLEAEYYDTADLRLIRAGITLRRRRGGPDAGWRLHLPGGRPPEPPGGAATAPRDRPPPGRGGGRGARRTGRAGPRAHPRRAAPAHRPGDHPETAPDPARPVRRVARRGGGGRRLCPGPER